MEQIKQVDGGSQVQGFYLFMPFVDKIVLGKCSNPLNLTIHDDFDKRDNLNMQEEIIMAVTICFS